MKEVYLGDGLYVSYDGCQIKLRAPRAFKDDDIIYMEGSVLSSFLQYLKEAKIIYFNEEN